MSQVEVIQHNARRGRVFWSGFLVGVFFALIALIVFWFLGVVDIGRQNSATSSEADNVVTDFDNSFVASDTLSNNTSNGTNNSADTDSFNAAANDTTNNTTNSTESAPVSGSVDFYKSGVMATGVDSSANPEGQTSTFSKIDKRFYAVLNLGTDTPKDAEISVKWHKGESLLSEFSTKTDPGQTRVYFFQTNPGSLGDYSAEIFANGTKVDTIKFSVQ